jgi:tetratricopeptide (TPR) repeat protein
MDIYQVVSEWGKVAGIAGMALGILLIIFREIVRRDIFPTLDSANATRILTLIIVFTFAVAIVSIAAYVILSGQERNSKTKLVQFLLLIETANARELESTASTAEDQKARLARLHYLQEKLPEEYGKFEQAVDAAEDLIRASSGVLVETQRTQAAENLKRGDPSAAVVALQEIANTAGKKSAEAHYTAAVLLESLGRFDEAIQEYRAAADTSPNEERYFTALTGLALDVGKAELAKQLANTRLSGPGLSASMTAYYTGIVAEAEWFLGDIQSSIKSYDDAIAGAGTAPTIYLAKALNDSSAPYYSLGKFDIAETRAGHSVAIFACALGRSAFRTRNALWNLARIYLSEGKIAAARGSLAMATPEKGDEEGSTESAEALAVPLVLSALIDDESGNSEQAVRKLRSADDTLVRARRDESFRYARVTRYLGTALIEQNDLDSAEKALSKSLLLMQKIFGRQGAETAVVIANLALVDGKRGRLAVSSSAVAMAQHSFPESELHGPNYLAVLDVGASIAHLASDAAGEEQLLEAAAELYRSTPTSSPKQLVLILSRLKNLLHTAHQDQRADALDAEINELDSKYKLLSTKPFIPPVMPCSKA